MGHVHTGVAISRTTFAAIIVLTALLIPAPATAALEAPEVPEPPDPSEDPEVPEGRVFQTGIGHVGPIHDAGIAVDRTPGESSERLYVNATVNTTSATRADASLSAYFSTPG